MAARKTLIDRIRAEVQADGGSVLLLSGGDINTGVPESDLQNAEPDFKAMVMLDYDAMALGNHEFDNPLAVLDEQQSWVDFPMLSANIYDKSGDRPYQAFEIFEQQGVKVAVIGLTTEDTSRIGNPEYISELDFRDMSGENVANVDFKPGDACQPDQQNGTWIVQAHEWGKYVGRVDLLFRNGELSLERYQLIPVNLKKKVEIDGEKKRVFIQDEILADADVQAFLEPFQTRGEELIGFKVGGTTGRLEGDRDKVRFGQTNLGRLIATAQAAKARADFGVMNSGGVRASIEAGDISYRDVLTVQPFGNSLTYTDMTGAEVVDYLNVVAGMPVDSGAYAVLKEFIERYSPIDPAVFEPAGEITYE